MFASPASFQFPSPRRSLPRRGLVFLLLCLASALAGPCVAATPAETAQPSVRVIRFDDLKPEGSRLTTCWDAVAIDERQRVYIAFSDQNKTTPHDTVLFRYDPRTDRRELLGTLRQISRDEGNLAEGETIAKIHVPFQEHRGKFYFSSHDYHSYDGPQDLTARRGGHFYSYDLQSEKFADLSKNDPGGVSVPHQGIIGLAILRQHHKLAGFTFPHGDILIHDLDRGTTTLHPGVPEHRQGGKPSRQIFATDTGKVYFSYYDRRSSPLYVFDLHTGAIEATKDRYHFGMVYGAIPTRDGRRIYLVDLLGNLYAFDTREERLEDLGSLLPPDQIAAGVKVEICYTVVLSRDEKKLYTFPSRLSEAPALRVYEHDLATGRNRQVADFTAALNGTTSDGRRADANGRITGSGVIDEQGRMYFGYHESGDEGRNGVLLQVTLAGENE